MNPPRLILLVALLAVSLLVPGCGDGQGTETTAETQPGASSTTGTQPGASSTVPATAPSSTTTSTAPPTTASTTTTTTRTAAEAALDTMTLRQKAAQVMLLTFQGTTLTPATEELLEGTPPGGLLLMGANITDAAQLTRLAAALQAAATAGGGAGLLIAVDQEGGSVARIRDGVPAVPSARKLGQQGSTAEASRLAGETAAALLRLGVNMNLAPVADVVSDGRSFLYGRSYGGEPQVVEAFVQAVVQAQTEAELMTALKHFPGHGSASGNTHTKRVVSRAAKKEFTTVHLPPFQTGIAAGADCVMMAHIVAQAYDSERPASLSSAIVEGLLRDELGFSGVVVTDDLEMIVAQRAAEQPARPVDRGGLAVQALQAGCDLLVSTGTLAQQQAMVDGIVAAVKDGRLPQSRLDEAALRILELKSSHGLLGS